MRKASRRDFFITSLGIARFVLSPLSPHAKVAQIALGLQSDHPLPRCG